MSDASDLRLCFVGDSFVVGTGDPDGLGWVGRACAPLRRTGVLTVYNLGVRGETSEAIARRAPAELAARLPSHAEGRVALSFGMNDTGLHGGAPRVELASTLAHARGLILALGARWPLLIVGPPPVAEPGQAQRLAALTLALGALCGERRVAWLPLFDTLSATPAWMDDLAAGDGMHPGARGYASLAAQITASAVWARWLAGEAVG